MAGNLFPFHANQPLTGVKMKNSMRRPTANSDREVGGVSLLNGEDESVQQLKYFRVSESYTDSARVDNLSGAYLQPCTDLFLPEETFTEQESQSEFQPCCIGYVKPKYSTSARCANSFQPCCWSE